MSESVCRMSESVGRMSESVGRMLESVGRMSDVGVGGSDVGVGGSDVGVGVSDVGVGGSGVEGSDVRSGGSDVGVGVSDVGVGGSGVGVDKGFDQTPPSGDVLLQASGVLERRLLPSGRVCRHDDPVIPVLGLTDHRTGIVFTEEMLRFAKNVPTTPKKEGARRGWTQGESMLVQLAVHRQLKGPSLRRFLEANGAGGRSFRSYEQRCYLIRKTGREEEDGAERAGGACKRLKL